jgi:antitoxin component of RelBE/YafQ-DinJ toxin-antitoxin module
MISQVIVNVDSKLKNLAMKKAQKQGIPFSAVLKLAIKAFVEDKFGIGLVADFNKKTRKEMDEAMSDIKSGKNLSPRFASVGDARAWFDN